MAASSFKIATHKLTRMLAAKIAATTGAVAAGIDGAAAYLACDENGALIVAAPNGLPVNPAAASAFTSGTATVGAASAQLLAASATRKYVLIQNTPASPNTLYLSFTNPATTADIALLPGASILLTNPAPSGALYAIGGGAGTLVAYLTA